MHPWEAPCNIGFLVLQLSANGPSSCVGLQIRQILETQWDGHTVGWAHSHLAQQGLAGAAGRPCQQ